MILRPCGLKTKCIFSSLVYKVVNSGSKKHCVKIMHIGLIINYSNRKEFPLNGVVQNLVLFIGVELTSNLFIY